MKHSIEESIRSWEEMSDKDRDTAISYLSGYPVSDDIRFPHNALLTGHTPTSFRVFCPTTDIKAAMEVEDKIALMDSVIQWAYIDHLEKIVQSFVRMEQGAYKNLKLRMVNASAEDRMQAAYLTLSGYGLKS